MIKGFGVGWLSMLALAGCGGDSGGNGSGSGMAYAFVPPVVNSVRNYAETVVDNSSNSIDIGYTQTVTAVNADGTIVEQVASSTGNSSIIDGTNYAIVAETENYNDMGQETSYVYTDDDGNPVTCTFDPHGSGPDYPLTVGETWTLDYTFTCGTNEPITYAQSGSVIDVESVTVPAGSYTAIKLQSTLTWTNAAGTTRTQTITNWRDVATSHTVKEQIAIAVSGTPPTAGYAVSRETVLESES